MSDVRTIVADIRRAIVLLAELDDPAATRIARGLARCLAGESIETAMDLPSDWRERLRIELRNLALGELVRLHPQLSANALAAMIAKGTAAARRRPDHIRPTGIAGYMHDLARVDAPKYRQLRRLISEIRVGHQDQCDGQQSLTASAAQP